MTERRGIVILGSTGSVGTQTLDVVRQLPDRFRVVGLAAGRNAELLAQQIAEFDVPYVTSVVPLTGADQTHRVSMEDLVSLPDVDLVVVATSSTAALSATLRALSLGRSVATANKEVLVAAGELVVATAREHGSRLLPIDSEHNAIWQCLRGEDGGEVLAGTTVERIVLTASGGAFRDLPLDSLGRSVAADALKHPIWTMGSKITIDSATLVNKAFEVIEAHWLFALPFEKIEVVLHRESVVHSIVQFVDGSSKAQLGLPDMRGPIQYALTYPERVAGPVSSLNVSSLGRLSFEPVDTRRYPAFSVVVDAGRRAGTYPAAVSAANDVIVDEFLKGGVSFGEMAAALESTVERHESVVHPSLDNILEAERWARDHVHQWLQRRRHAHV